ncbi:MAG: hypothetical protein WKG03_09140 [Telluria sp.]
MEIFEFLAGCLEVLAEWRVALMLAVGVILAFIILMLLGTDPPAIILAAIAFLGSFIWGMRWQKAAERRG